MKIYIGADHLGIEQRDNIIKYLLENEINVINSVIENSSTDDYTDFAFDVCEKVVKDNALGVLICGNGVGMSIAANKVKGIRAARVLNTDDAFKAKNHNGANVIAISANNDINENKKIIDTFILTKFPTEERYLRRVGKIDNYEL